MVSEFLEADFSDSAWAQHLLLQISGINARDADKILRDDDVIAASLATRERYLFFTAPVMNPCLGLFLSTRLYLWCCAGKCMAVFRLDTGVCFFPGCVVGSSASFVAGLWRGWRGFRCKVRKSKCRLSPLKPPLSLLLAEAKIYTGSTSFILLGFQDLKLALVLHGFIMASSRLKPWTG